MAKSIHLSVLIAVFSASFASAANVHWKDAGTSGLWTDGSKWQGGQAPQNGDTPYLDRSNIEVTLTDAVNRTFLEFKGPGHNPNITNAVLNIEGGYLRVLDNPPSNETFRIAYSEGSSGRVNMSGGLIEVGDFNTNAGDFQVGRSGAGALFMTGGEIRIARHLAVTSTGTGAGHVKIYDDATIRVGGNLTRSQFSSVVRIDIGGGELILSGDKRQHVQNWINAGSVVAYDGHPRSRLVVSYETETDETMVTAILPDVTIAGEPLPWEGQAVDSETNLSLIWIQADDVTEQHIYWGSDYNAVQQAQIDDTTGILQHIAGPEVYFHRIDRSDLLAGETYYWRVDGIVDGTLRTGDIWSFEVIEYTIPLHGDLTGDGKVDLSDFAMAAFDYDPQRLHAQMMISDIFRNWLTDIDGVRPVDAPFDTSAIVAPTFPDVDFSITAFGAVSGGQVVNTSAIQSAINNCSWSGGGRVIVPAGVWLSGPIRIRSNVNLHLEDGAEILFSKDINDYLPKIYIYPYTRPDMGYERAKPYIYAMDAENIAITGQGSAVLNAQGRLWSDADSWKQLQGVDFISPINTENILIEGVTLLYGSSWNIVPRYSRNLIIRGVHLVTQGPATDGIDVYSTQDVLVEQCYITCGDDAVVMHTDRDEAGWAINIPTERVVVRNNYLQTPMAAMAVGSQTSAGIRDILFQDNFVGDDTGAGFWLKSRRGRGGVAENIWVKDITIGRIIPTGSSKAINLSMLYTWNDTPQTEVPPIFRNIVIENIRCQQATSGQRQGGLIQIRGLDDSYIENVSISNVIGYEPGGFGIYADYVKNAVFADIEMNPFPVDKWPAVEFQNVKNTIAQRLTCPDTVDLFFSIAGAQTENMCLKDNIGAIDYLFIDDSVLAGEVSVQDCP